jgi:hypothetical protein
MQAEHLARLKKMDRYPHPEPFADLDDLAKQILASSVIPALKKALLATAAVGDRTTRLAPVPSEPAPVGYVDRPEFKGPLLAHLLKDEPTPKGRVMISVVHGLGGIGKTTVAQWLVWRPEIEQRFPDGRVWVTLGGESDAPDAITVVTDCVSQLDPALKTKATVEAARADLSALLQDRSVLFVIDDVWPGKSAEVAKAIVVPSPRSRFLLTTRFPQLADDPGIRAEDFPLDEMSFDQAVELIVRVLGRELTAAEQFDAERLWEVVGGHPLALELAAARIKEGRPWKALLDALDAEIARLEALEEVDDDLIVECTSSETRRRRTSVRASLLLSVRYLSRPGQQLFAWLGVVAEEALITPRLAATLWSEDEEAARRHLRRLSNFGLLSARGDGYVIHDLMHDLARELLTAPETVARPGDIPRPGLTVQDGHRRLIESYRNKTSQGHWYTLPEDAYIRDHLVHHFEQAGAETDLEGLLWDESEDGHCGWYQARERLGQTGGFLRDVGRIWGHADRLGAIAASEVLRAQAIALQLHCALIIASTNSLSATIPVEVLVGAVRYGVLPLPSALVLARQNPDPLVRVDLLLALESETLRSQRRSLLGEALQIARGIDDAQKRVLALKKVLHRLPTEEALRAARDLDDAGTRAELLAKVAERLSAEDQHSVLREALGAARGADFSESRALALAQIAKQLPKEEQPGVLDEALSAARGIDHPIRARVLAEVATRLPAEEALAVARGIDHAQPRAELLAKVAERLPAEDRHSVLGEALRVAHGIDHRLVRAATLKEVAKRLSTQEALAVARSIDDAQPRARVLAEVAERLPTDEALAVARGVDDAVFRAQALAEVALRLPTDEALAVARGIDRARLRAETLAKVAERLPEEDRPRVLGEAFIATRALGDGASRAWALAQIAQRLPKEEQTGVLDEALSTARGINSAWFRAGALAEVAKRLPKADQSSVLGEALGAARGIDHPIMRGWALAEVATRLPAEEALAVARSIEEVESRVEALAEVAQRLPAVARPAVLREAFSAMHGIYGVASRARARAKIVQWLPAEEVLILARGINDAGSRAEALAEVAERLPAVAPVVRREALTVARGIDQVLARETALAKVAERLPVEEALAVARSIDDARPRAYVLAGVAKKLPAEQALAIVQGIDDAGTRAEALAEVAERLPAKAQPVVRREALTVAHGIDDGIERARALAMVAKRLPAYEALAVARGIKDRFRDADGGPRAWVLAEVAKRLPAEEALAVARDIDDARPRARTLSEIAGRLDPAQISESSMRLWAETARVLAMRQRTDCIADFAAVLPFIQALGGENPIRSLGRSIASVGAWWP